MKVINYLRATLICVVMGVAACSSQGAPALSAADSPPALEASEYKLGPGDELSISVFGRPELTGTFPVSAEGTIAYPLLGNVHAGGLTLQGLTESLTNTLRPDYVRDPNVNVAVSKYRPFFILGEVGNAGTYPFTPGLTVMSAVATAGGFSYRANSHRVFIQHPGDETEHEYSLTSATPVQPGDTVRIPERRF